MERRHPHTSTQLSQHCSLPAAGYGDRSYSGQRHRPIVCVRKQREAEGRNRRQKTEQSTRTRVQCLNPQCGLLQPSVRDRDRARPGPRTNCHSSCSLVFIRVPSSKYTAGGVMGDRKLGHQASAIPGCAESFTSSLITATYVSKDAAGTFKPTRAHNVCSTCDTKLPGRHSSSLMCRAAGTLKVATAAVAEEGATTRTAHNVQPAAGGTKHCIAIAPRTDPELYEPLSDMLGLRLRLPLPLPLELRWRRRLERLRLDRLPWSRPRSRWRLLFFFLCRWLRWLRWLLLRPLFSIVSCISRTNFCRRP